MAWVIEDKSKKKGWETYNIYDEAVDIVGKRALVVCRVCRKEYIHPRFTDQGTTSTIVKHRISHRRDSESETVTTANSQISDIRGFLGTTPSSTISQDEFDELLLRCMVASNWPFSQFDIQPFITLLSIEYPKLTISSSRVIKRRLSIYSLEAREEVRKRLGQNESAISLVLDLWTSPNNLEFMGTCPPFIAWHIEYSAYVDMSGYN
jgi:hypothetical protein